MTPLNIGISETIRDHLTKQKAKAGVPRPEGENPPIHCLYRAPNGNTCAVGCLIPESQYSESFEGEPIDGNTNAQDLRKLLFDLYPGVDLGMLRSWQLYHDGTSYTAWCEGVANARSPADFHAEVIGKL